MEITLHDYFIIELTFEKYYSQWISPFYHMYD